MTDVIERDSATPIYQQLEDIFHAKIASGEWAPEHRIPSVNVLNREYSLSRMTIRGVLNKLAGDGLLIRVAGKGTFVAPQKINAVSPVYKGIREQLEVLGYDIATTLISTERVPAPTRVREHLNLPAGAEVIAGCRQRAAVRGSRRQIQSVDEERLRRSGSHRRRRNRRQAAGAAQGRPGTAVDGCHHEPGRDGL